MVAQIYNTIVRPAVHLLTLGRLAHRAHHSFLLLKLHNGILVRIDRNDEQVEISLYETPSTTRMAEWFDCIVRLHSNIIHPKFRDLYHHLLRVKIGRYNVAGNNCKHFLPPLFGTFKEGWGDYF